MEGRIDGVLHIAMRCRSTHSLPSLIKLAVSQGLFRIHENALAEIPYLQLADATHFCLDQPMGPGVSSLHDRPTRRIMTPCR